MKRNLSYVKIHFILCSKTLLVIKTNQSLLYGEIIDVYSEIETKHVKTLYGQNIKVLILVLVVHKVTGRL